MPTITVTTEQQTRILAAYKDYFGTTTAAETVAAYKRMLADMVKAQVLAYESKQLMAQMPAKEAEVNSFLNGIQ